MNNGRPIILIPGIQGTTLNNVNDNDFVKLFSGYRKYYKNIHHLKLKKDGVTDSKDEVIIERSDVEDLAYREIINYLRELKFKVYIFGYDWRLSNIENGKRLDTYIKVLSKKLRTRKFNFLTHSMGGLVLSSYCRLKTPQQLNNIMDKVIISNPPFLGSLAATFNLIIGKSKLFNSSDDFRKAGRTFPSIYELCPVYDGSYNYEDNRSDIDYFDYAQSFQREQASPETDDRIRKKIAERDELMIFRFNEVREVRRERDRLIYDFAALSQEMRDKMLILVGSNSKTYKTLPVKTGQYDPLSRKTTVNFFDFEEAYENRDEAGDGTVHHLSSNIFKDSIMTLDVKNRKFETVFDSRLIGGSDWHSFFLNNGRVQNIIKRFFAHDNDRLTQLYATNWWASTGGGVEVIS